MEFQPCGMAPEECLLSLDVLSWRSGSFQGPGMFSLEPLEGGFCGSSPAAVSLKAGDPGLAGGAPGGNRGSPGTHLWGNRVLELRVSSKNVARCCSSLLTALLLRRGVTYMWLLRLKEGLGDREGSQKPCQTSWLQAQESAGRSLGCSEFKKGGFGLNTNFNAIIPFVCVCVWERLRSDLEYSTAHWHKIWIINETTGISYPLVSQKPLPLLEYLQWLGTSHLSWHPVSFLELLSNLLMESNLHLCHFYLSALVLPTEMPQNKSVIPIPEKTKA